jgi:gluconokinase
VELKEAGCQVNWLISESARVHQLSRACSRRTPDLMKAMTKLIIMGVSGAGKTTLGLALGDVLGWHFLDADDFHTPAAKAKIASGQVLDEADRLGWLTAIAPRFETAGESTILACSALKAVHRDSLKHDVLVHIVIEPTHAVERLTNRRDHFAGPSIAASQFEALELPHDAIRVPATWTTPEQVNYILKALKA